VNGALAQAQIVEGAQFNFGEGTTDLRIMVCRTALFFRIHREPVVQEGVNQVFDAVTHPRSRWI